MAVDLDPMEGMEGMEMDESMASEMAQSLRAAMKGLGCDKQALVNILCPMSSANIRVVRKKYSEEIKRDLYKDIKSETGGDLEKVLLQLLLLPCENDADILRIAMAGIGSNKDWMTEILCTRSPEELAEISMHFERLFKKKLLSQIEDESSGDLEKCYNLLLTADRKTPPESQLDEDVQELYEAGEKRWGTNEGVFVRKLCGYSREYNEQLYFKYAEKHGKALDRVIHNEMKGNLGNALAALVTPLDQFFADKLFKSMKGLGTDESTLTRIIVTQRERHLPAIAKRFLMDHKETLKVWVKKECGGAYGKALISICDNWASVVDKK
jgi:hypothetical protein